MVHVITGGAGFVACNLIPRLLGLGHVVVALDNLQRGREDFLTPYRTSDQFRFAVVDCSDREALGTVLRNIVGGETVSDVWHLAANSDIPAGVADPGIDLTHTFMTTFSTLAVMSELQIRRIHFASSSAIYGDHQNRRVQEDTGPFLPISNYGAMKLASEALISAAAEQFLDKANIFRFPNVVGTPATHGVIYDFVHKLQADPTRLAVLGNGRQQKAYLHVDDLVSAMLFIEKSSCEKVGIYNIGPADDGTTVGMIAETVREVVSPRAEIQYGQGDRGWVGDVPRFRYDGSKLAQLGWTPRFDSEAAIRRAVGEIAAQMGA